jgi:hypothetical protein
MYLRGLAASDERHTFVSQMLLDEVADAKTHGARQQVRTLLDERDVDVMMAGTHRDFCTDETTSNNGEVANVPKCISNSGRICERSQIDNAFARREGFEVSGVGTGGDDELVKWLDVMVGDNLATVEIKAGGGREWPKPIALCGATQLDAVRRYRTHEVPFREWRTLVGKLALGGEHRDIEVGPKAPCLNGCSMASQRPSNDDQSAHVASRSR